MFNKTTAVCRKWVLAKLPKAFLTYSHSERRFEVRIGKTERLIATATTEQRAWVNAYESVTK